MKRPSSPQKTSAALELTASEFQLPGVLLAEASDFSAPAVAKDFNLDKFHINPIEPKKWSSKLIFESAYDQNEHHIDAEAPSGPREYAFSEIVDEDDNELLENYVSEELIGQCIESGLFRTGILICILMNTVTIGLQTDIAFEKQYSSILNLLDYIFLTVFAVEIILKLMHGFVGFWKVGWNVFDFSIVVISFLGDNIEFLSSGRVFRMFRVLRAFRTLRGINALQGLQMVVQTVIQSLPDMLNVMLLLFIIMFIFSILGISLFAEISPMYFGTMGANFMTLFIMLTQDGWVTIFKELVEVDESQYLLASMYFVLFIVVGAFMFANIVVGIVVTNLQSTYDELKAENKAKTRELTRRQKVKTVFRDVADIDHVEEEHWRQQLPHELPDMSQPSLSALENYYLVLVALEENMVEYKKLKEQIEDYFQEVVGLNEDLEVSESEDDSDSDDESAPRGDVLSRLIRSGPNRNPLSSKFINF